VTEWQPEPFVNEGVGLALPPPPTIIGPPSLHPRVLVGDKEKQVTNLSGPNFSGLLGNQRVKDRAIECLRAYGVGSCGPPGFYGTFGKRLSPLF
jgi:serine palmitoyltransferase